MRGTQLVSPGFARPRHSATHAPPRPAPIFTNTNIPLLSLPTFTSAVNACVVHARVSHVVRALSGVARVSTTVCVCVLHWSSDLQQLSPPCPSCSIYDTLIPNLSLFAACCLSTAWVCSGTTIPLSTFIFLVSLMAPTPQSGTFLKPLCNPAPGRKQALPARRASGAARSEHARASLSSCEPQLVCKRPRSFYSFGGLCPPTRKREPTELEPPLSTSNSRDRKPALCRVIWGATLSAPPGLPHTCSPGPPPWQAIRPLFDPVHLPFVQPLCVFHWPSCNSKFPG
jgi:hypothetical protein